MDTLYFATDMTAFVAQVRKWLKKDGVFFVGYQEGDVIPKTPNAHTTMLVKALTENGMTYEVTDITKQTYQLLKIKRESAIKHRAMFEAEGHSQWFDVLIGQTEYSKQSFDQFKEQIARYIYVIRK